MIYLVAILLTAGGCVSALHDLGYLRWFGPVLASVGAWMFAKYFERKRGIDLEAIHAMSVEEMQRLMIELERDWRRQA